MWSLCCLRARLIRSLCCSLSVARNYSMKHFFQFCACRIFMKPSQIRLLGILIFLFEVLMLLVLISPRARQLGPLTSSAIIRISLFFFSATVIGSGLLFLRKWAALFFSLASVAAVTWLILGSIWEVPFPWNLINITMGIVFLLPTIGIIRSWSLLSWGGKRFF